MGSFVLRVEGDSLQMVSFRVKVWVTYIVFLSHGIFRSKSRGQLGPPPVLFGRPERTVRKRPKLAFYKTKQDKQHLHRKTGNAPLNYHKTHGYKQIYGSFYG